MRIISGQTTAEKSQALEKFRNGEVTILVATSVAEQGLDIAECNLVINYERQLDEVAKVQSEGT